MATRIVVQSGSGQMPRSNMLGLIALSEDQQSPYTQRLVVDYNVQGKIEGSLTHKRYTLRYILETFGETQCKDIHDSLYAFRAIVIDGDRLKVNYEEPPSLLLVRAVKVLNLGIDDLQPDLSAVKMDANPLFVQCGITAPECQETQKVLAQIPHILVTKCAFPLCSADADGLCLWSIHGNQAPCSTCFATIYKICDMPKCAYECALQVKGLLDLHTDNSDMFANTYLSQFRQWLCSVWPTHLAGPHVPNTDHCSQCYACDLRKKAYV